MDNNKNAFIPSLFDAVALSVTSFALLVILNFKQVVAFLTGQDKADIEREVFPLLQDFLLDMLSVMTAKATTFLFWLVVGYLGLMIIEASIWLIRLYHSDVPRKGWIHPRTYGYSGRDILVHFIVRTAALLGILSWLVLLFIFMLPFCNKLFLDGLQLNEEVYKILLASLSLAAYAFLAGVLIRLLILRRHILN